MPAGLEVFPSSPTKVEVTGEAVAAAEALATLPRTPPILPQRQRASRSPWAEMEGDPAGQAWRYLYERQHGQGMAAVGLGDVKEEVEGEGRVGTGDDVFAATWDDQGLGYRWVWGKDRSR